MYLITVSKIETYGSSKKRVLLTSRDGTIISLTKGKMNYSEETNRKCVRPHALKKFHYLVENYSTTDK